MPQTLDFSTDILEIEPHLDSSLDVFNVSSSDQYMQFPLFDDVLVSPISSVEMSSHMELATKLLSKSIELSEVDVLPSCAISNRRQSGNTIEKDSNSSKNLNCFYFPGAPDILVEDKDSAVLLSDLCAESCYFPMNNNLDTGPDYGTAVATPTDSGNSSQCSGVLENHSLPSALGNEVIEEIWKKHCPNQAISVAAFEADAGQTFNLPQIVHSVCSLGGIKQVRSKKLWNTVALQHDISIKTIPLLKKFYNKFIGPYEEEIWGSLIENIEQDHSSPNRKGPQKRPSGSKNKDSEVGVRKTKRRRSLIHIQHVVPNAVSPTLNYMKEGRRIEHRIKPWRNGLSNNDSKHIGVVQHTRFYVLSRSFPSRNLLETFYHVLDMRHSFVCQVRIGNLHFCSCSGSLCEHILFVLLRVLNVPLASPLLFQEALLNEELELVYICAHQLDPRMHYQITTSKQSDAPTCPVCYETVEQDDFDAIVRCRRLCGASLHKVCWEHWSSQPTASHCPVCGLS